MRPTRWQRSTYVVVGAAVLLLVVAVVAAAAVVASRQTGDEVAVEPVPPPATAEPEVVPVSTDATAPTPRGLARALAPVLADPNLGRFTGRITDAMTGQELWAVGAEIPMQPASTNKLLTAAAALLAVVIARAPHRATLVLASDAPSPVTDRTIVTVAASAAEVPA